MCYLNWTAQSCPSGPPPHPVRVTQLPTGLSLITPNCPLRGGTTCAIQPLHSTLPPGPLLCDPRAPSGRLTRPCTVHTGQHGLSVTISNRDPGGATAPGRASAFPTWGWASGPRVLRSPASLEAGPEPELPKHTSLRSPTCRWDVTSRRGEVCRMPSWCRAGARSAPGRTSCLSPSGRPHQTSCVQSPRQPGARAGGTQAGASSPSGHGTALRKEKRGTLTCGQTRRHRPNLAALQIWHRHG